MRKVLIIAAVLVVGFFIGLYLLIPSTIHVSQAQYFPIPPGTVARCFNNLQNSKEGLPKGARLNGKTIEYNGLQFTLAPLHETALQKIVITTSSSDTINSLISSNQLAKDSSFMYWECNLIAGSSPLSHLEQYNKAKKIKKSIDSILGAFAQYTISQKNLYGIPISKTRVKDSILISEKKTVLTYPTTTQVYELINSLKKYISDQQGEETGLPMLNVTKFDSGYTMMAAIPIKKLIPETETKRIKRVLYNGNLLMTEVQGGISAINDAFQKLEDYKQDYYLQSPAIPYQQLLTDRTKITDTTQWQTRIYYPFY